MNGSPDILSTAIKMFASLAFVLGGMFILFHFMKKLLKRNTTGSRDKLVRVIGNTYLGVKKSISLVEIPGAILVIGITNENISLLSKIDDENILGGLKLSDGDNFQGTFSGHLNRITEKLRKNNRNI